MTARIRYRWCVQRCIAERTTSLEQRSLVRRWWAASARNFVDFNSNLSEKGWVICLPLQPRNLTNPPPILLLIFLIVVTTPFAFTLGRLSEVRAGEALFGFAGGSVDLDFPTNPRLAPRLWRRREMRRD